MKCEDLGKRGCRRGICLVVNNSFYKNDISSNLHKSECHVLVPVRVEGGFLPPRSDLWNYTRDRLHLRCSQDDRNIRLSIYLGPPVSPINTKYRIGCLNVFKGWMKKTFDLIGNRLVLVNRRPVSRSSDFVCTSLSYQPVRAPSIDLLTEIIELAELCSFRQAALLHPP